MPTTNWWIARLPDCPPQARCHIYVLWYANIASIVTQSRVSLGSLSTGPGKSLQFLRRLIYKCAYDWSADKAETQQPKNAEKEQEEAVQACLHFDWFEYDVSENTKELVPCPEKCLDDPCPCSRWPTHWRLIETRVKAGKKIGQKSAIIINGTS